MGATRLIERREPQILSSPLCGEGQHCPRNVRASRSWVVFWAMMILFMRTHQAHRTLLQRIPRVPDVQSAWVLLLHCASARANYSLRVVRPELVEGTDFGQSRFGHPDLTNFGQSIFANPFLDLVCVMAPKGGAQTQKKSCPEGWRAQNFALFFPSPASSFALFVSHCVSSRVFFFGGNWKRRGRQMCTFGVLGLLCEAPASPKPPGFHTTAREPKRAHLRVPVFTKTTEIPRENTQ